MDEYQENRLTLGNIVRASWTDQQKQDLIHCYEVGTIRRDLLIAELRTHHRSFGIEKCHYCGLNGISSTDHYLPKEKFPEYSVMALNMVPCCGDCNNLKRSAHMNSAGLSTLSVYFDEVPKERCLFVDLKWEYDNCLPIPNFRLRRTDAMDPKFFARIESHFSILRLFERYQRAAGQVMSEDLTTLWRSRSFRELEQGFRVLHDGAEALVTMYSINYWASVLKHALCQDDRFRRLASTRLC